MVRYVWVMTWAPTYPSLSLVYTWQLPLRCFVQGEFWCFLLKLTKATKPPQPIHLSLSYTWQLPLRCFVQGEFWCFLLKLTKATKPHSTDTKMVWCVINKEHLTRVGFEPTPFRTRTLIWRLRPTRPSRHMEIIVIYIIFIYTNTTSTFKTHQTKYVQYIDIHETSTIPTSKMPHI